jgi:undecaprenyl-diphosphatase
MTIFQAIILAIIEGLTEFLPVSSTGHMVIASAVMGIGTDEFVKLFEVVIQLGAILSVVVLYFKRFFRSIDFYFKLVVGVLPAVIVGVLFKSKINELLESPLVVAFSLLIGGVILLFVDQWFNRANVNEEKNISYLTALKIGFFQCLAVVQKLTRTAAAEFSFFLAVPTMLGATLKELYDFHKTHEHMFTGDQVKLLIIGNVVAFIVAMLAIRSFITFLEKKGFRLFGIYRIVVGIAIIALYFTGHFAA